MEFRLDRKAFHRGSLADDEQNEGYAEYAAMSPEERLEAVGFLHRQHARFFLGLPELPPMRREVFKVVDLGSADE